MLAAAIVLPSGENTTVYTYVPESGTTASCRGRAGSASDHSRRVPSSPPVARILPSGLNATDSALPFAVTRNGSADRGQGPGVEQPSRAVAAGDRDQARRPVST